jgi:hypothetical protein
MAGLLGLRASSLETVLRCEDWEEEEGLWGLQLGKSKRLTSISIMHILTE